MTSKSWIYCGIALGMMGSCGVLLARSQALLRQGKPGLKVVAEPIHDTDGRVAGTNQVFLPERVLSWQSKPLPVTRQELDWLPPDTTYGRRRYSLPDGSWLDMGVVLMGMDRTSIHKPEYCLPGQGFAIDPEQGEVTSIQIGVPRPYVLPVRKLVATRKLKTADGREETVRAIFVYWFVADGQITASHLQRMLWMGWDMIGSGTLQRWAYVSAFAICRSGEEGATFERMKTFLAAAVPEFQLVSDAASPAASIEPGEAKVSGVLPAR